jgi:hypothetical protein
MSRLERRLLLSVLALFEVPAALGHPDSARRLSSGGLRGWDRVSRGSPLSRSARHPGLRRHRGILREARDALAGPVGPPAPAGLHDLVDLDLMAPEVVKEQVRHCSLSDLTFVVLDVERPPASGLIGVIVWWPWWASRCEGGCP